VREVVEWVVSHLVDDPGGIEITESRGERSTTYEIRVAPDDMGKVIGRGGRTARAIRSLAKAFGPRLGENAFVRIVD
jgi:predicted RNA-binding protein YlqC (UPF0109 family)